MARKLQEYPSVSLELDDLGGRIDFVRIFGRKGPVHIEIGSGKGTFLLKQAEAQPSANFLGIEWARKYYRYSVDRIGRWGLKNVRIIRTDAVVFLSDFIDDGSVDYFHIYFPDPWPKKRHHKRRLICPSNLEHLIRCLETDGELKIATDHADYFEVIQGLIKNHQERLEEVQFLPTAGADTGEWIGTNFERKYIKDQRAIYTLAVRKI
ncbi:MAG: tRNA (guanosine(46)-N7)-methyltransferase TrmB [Sedimentisphaerales bacterium]|nr:tRNA (guanosine(46)-N7)-methyltransferase TrmB [Sedimentisphaerales bacterium]